MNRWNRLMAGILIAPLLSISFGVNMGIYAANGEPGWVEVNKTIERSWEQEGYYDISLSVKGIRSIKKVDVILTVDVSTSMTNNGSTRLVNAKRAAAAFTEQILGDPYGQNRIAVVTFEGKVKDVRDFTNDKADILQIINSLTTENSKGTNIQIGLLKTGEIMANAERDADKVVVFLGDGEPNVYVPGMGTEIDCDLIQGLAEDVSIYAVGLEVTGKGEEVLRSLPRGKGNYIKASSEDLQSIYEDLAGTIKYAATGSVVTDVMSEYIDKNSFKFVKSNNSDFNYDHRTGKLIWTPKVIDERGAFFTYRVKPIEELSQGAYPANEYAELKYINIDEQEENKYFPIPMLNIEPQETIDPPKVIDPIPTEELKAIFTVNYVRQSDKEKLQESNKFTGKVGETVTITAPTNEWGEFFIDGVCYHLVEGQENSFSEKLKDGGFNYTFYFEAKIPPKTDGTDKTEEADKTEELPIIDKVAELPTIIWAPSKPKPEAKQEPILEPIQEPKAEPIPVPIFEPILKPIPEPIVISKPQPEKATEEIIKEAVAQEPDLPKTGGIEGLGILGLGFAAAVLGFAVKNKKNE